MSEGPPQMDTAASTPLNKITTTAEVHRNDTLSGAEPPSSDYIDMDKEKFKSQIDAIITVAQARRTNQ